VVGSSVGVAVGTKLGSAVAYVGTAVDLVGSDVTGGTGGTGVGVALEGVWVGLAVGAGVSILSGGCGV
jgi:hypothetical protein